MRSEFAVVLACILAGCTSLPEAEPEPVLAATGVSGVTVNPNIEPIAGARVVLEPGGLEARTDPFGRFRFDEVAPGIYQLGASAEGHLDVQVRLQVAEGETVRPRLVLPTVEQAVARHETHEFQGRIESSWGPLDGPLGPVRQALGLAGCTCEFHVPAPATLVAVTVEAVWQDSVQRPDASTQMRWEVAGPNATLAGTAPSPLNAAVSLKDIGAFGPEVRVMLGPDGSWPTHDQGFQVFLTLWEVQGPPEGWSYVRGDP